MKTLHAILALCALTLALASCEAINKVAGPSVDDTAGKPKCPQDQLEMARVVTEYVCPKGHLAHAP